MNKIEIKKLQKPSMYKWISRALLDWAFLFFCLYLLVNLEWQFIWLAPIILYLIGARQHALSILMHDSAHFVISHNKAINDWITKILVSFPMLDNVEQFRKVHTIHHWQTGHDHDPEILLKKKFDDNFELPTKFSQILKTFLIDSSMLNTKELLWLSCIYERKSLKEELPLIIFWITLVSLSIFFNFEVYLLLWLLARFTTYMSFAHFRMWFEHSGDYKGIPHRYHANPILRFLFFPHNTFYHYEHHFHQAIPCWNLPKLREMLNPEEPVLTFVQMKKRIQGSE